MSEIRKSNLAVNGNNIHLSMPFAKVDKANRLVSGYATLDNIDTQGDVVTAEASQKAFTRARGNIREMHQPIAAGKMVDFREDEFFHDGKFYRGIFVTARISEGAEDTWKKVLDETLTGFSIGGEINKSSNMFVKDANGGEGGNVRFIEDYDLTELSLVDNPANQLANVMSIQKSAGSVTVKMGEVADAKVENVFICKTDSTIITKDTQSENCPLCGTLMENAGWFEAGADRAEKVSNIVTKFLNPAAKEAAPNSTEGGVEMAVEKSEERHTNVPNPSETFPDGTPVETEAPATVDEEGNEAKEVDETGGTEEEEAETPEEVTDEETEISKMLDELREAVTSSLVSNKEETLQKVAELEGKFDSVSETFLSKATELEEKIDGFSENIETQKSRLNELENSLNKMNNSGAFRKSADLQRSEEREVQKKTFWHGAFSD